MSAVATLSEKQIVAAVLKAQRAEWFHKSSIHERNFIESIARSVFTAQADGKRFTLILTYVETNLKAVRFCFSPDSETPEDVYKHIRKLGHKVRSLADDVEHYAPNWAQGLQKDALVTLAEAQRLGMDERYLDPTCYEWYTKERQEFYYTFALLAAKVHPATEAEVQRALGEAPLHPPHLNAEIERRLLAMRG